MSFKDKIKFKFIDISEYNTMLGTDKVLKPIIKGWITDNILSNYAFLNV